jgi:hypothetical protein
MHHLIVYAVIAGSVAGSTGGSRRPPRLDSLFADVTAASPATATRPAPSKFMLGHSGELWLCDSWSQYVS